MFNQLDNGVIPDDSPRSAPPGPSSARHFGDFDNGVIPDVVSQNQHDCFEISMNRIAGIYYFMN